MTRSDGAFVRVLYGFTGAAAAALAVLAQQDLGFSRPALILLYSCLLATVAVCLPAFFLLQAAPRLFTLLPALTATGAITAAIVAGVPTSASALVAIALWAAHFRERFRPTRPEPPGASRPRTAGPPPA